ncbi:Alpha/Beta hydrolase protein [Pterulicium gracile]|uniref:Alpha/Beta hydrolase protein n=1 Tax=Pterulicium gracile TaxID=1884261 RepID=A0A5C3Q8X4_9AGAR|nr:Alpha/Beta hydrolase protein [Pterula gracilis]
MSALSLLPITVLALSASLAIAQEGGNSTEAPEITPFNWTSVEATTDLQWQDCYMPPLQCTRFSVPLNYSNPDAGDAAIAVIRVPSSLPDTDEYRGPIFFNPGGPGGSGINEWITGTGLAFIEWIGPEYDFVTFDPRGVNNTTPAIQIFDDPEEEAAYIESISKSVDLSPDIWDTLPERLEDYRQYGPEINEKFGDIVRHSTTDNVARDMLAMVEAYGFEKLQYWGISYGSVLGSTFAAMFPDKVERIVIYGVISPIGYYNNDWEKTVVDADNGLLSFFELCAEAGAELCAFHNSTAEEIQERYNVLYERVTTRSIMISNDTPLGPATFESTIHPVLYWPHQFPAIARTLASLEEGITEPFEAESAVSAGTIIRCLDADIVRDTPEELIEYSEGVRNITKYLPGAVDGARMYCAGWYTNPDNFRGPFNKKKTSHPLLLIGNTYDVVTSLSEAHNTSALFEGSVVLTYDITGHTSIARASDCVHAYLRGYFINGTLPEEGTICQPNNPLIDVFSANTIEPGTGAGEDGDNGNGSGDGEDNGALGQFGLSWSYLYIALSAVFVSL